MAIRKTALESKSVYLKIMTIPKTSTFSINSGKCHLHDALHSVAVHKVVYTADAVERSSAITVYLISTDKIWKAYKYFCNVKVQRAGPSGRAV